MERILIIGSPGSGKSTLAIKLGEKLNLKVVHLDQLFWQENWVKRSKEEFLNSLYKELNEESWIIDGCFISTLSTRLEYCDHVILLNYSTLTCLFRVIKRVVKNRGKTRFDMADNCPEKLDFSFLKYVATFKRKKLPLINEALKNANVKVSQITNDKQLKLFLQTLSSN